MSSTRVVILLTALAIGAAGCRQTSEAATADTRVAERTREREFQQRLTRADADPTGGTPVARWIMPEELREISGLALRPDGMLLTHDDNVGKIYVVDPRRGAILKQFVLGMGVREDFESIAIAGKDIFLLASNGTLFQFREGPDGAGVPYTMSELGIADKCEFESMAYEADSDRLVMPCKKATSKELKDHLVIYRYRLSGPKSERLSVVSYPLKSIISKRWKGLHPSDMTIDPTTKNYVIIASREDALVELTPSGRPVRVETLPGQHVQPEGVAISSDSLLMVSDEGKKVPPVITLYRWRPSHSTSTNQ
jgi:uncharacterized protein YjiK